MKDLPIYELIIADETEGVEIVSLVNRPAVEKNFIAMNSDKVKLFSIDSEEKRIVTGVIMLPDTPIYRFDKDYGEHYVVFTKDTIRDLVYKFFKEGRTNMVNTEHWHFADSVYMIESYFKDSLRGVCPVEFSDIPDGSWLGTYRIENDGIWNKVKSGDFQGFSIEGYLSYKEKNNRIENIQDLLNQLAYED